MICLLFVLHVTGACNYKCEFCFAAALGVGRGDIEWSPDPVMERIRAADGTAIALSGGEPTLFRGLERIVVAARAHGLEVGLLTNGSSPHHPALGLVDTVQVSLDGPKDVHDRVRGMRGAFDKAINTIAAAHAAGTEVSVQVTVTKATVDTLAETMRVLLSLPGLAKIVVNAAVMRPPLPGRSPDNGLLWRDEVLEILQNVAFSTPDGPQIGTNICSAKGTCAALVRHLSGSLPRFVDASTGVVSLATPACEVGYLSQRGLGQRLATIQEQALKVVERGGSSRWVEGTAVCLDEILWSLVSTVSGGLPPRVRRESSSDASGRR